MGGRERDVGSTPTEPPPGTRTDKEKPRGYLRFHDNLLAGLSKLQPIVTLFTLSIVIATFTRTISPGASDWALLGAVGFAVTLLVSAAIVLTKSEGSDTGDLIFVVLAYLGGMLGFGSLLAVLLTLSSGNDTLIRGLVFILYLAIALGFLPVAFRDFGYLHELGVVHSDDKIRLTALSWRFVEGVELFGILLIVSTPPLWLILAKTTTELLFAFFVGFGVLLSVRFWRILRTRRLRSRRGDSLP